MVNAQAYRYRDPLPVDKTVKQLKPLFIQAGVMIRTWKPHTFPDSEKVKFPSILGKATKTVVSAPHLPLVRYAA